jgi:hypothetical protein
MTRGGSSDRVNLQLLMEGTVIRFSDVSDYYELAE